MTGSLFAFLYKDHRAFELHILKLIICLDKLVDLSGRFFTRFMAPNACAK